MMVRERKLFILILYAEIQSKSLNRGKNYIIQELTDSTLIFQYLPDTLTIGVGSGQMRDRQQPARTMGE